MAGLRAIFFLLYTVEALCPMLSYARAAAGALTPRAALCSCRDATSGLFLCAPWWLSAPWGSFAVRLMAILADLMGFGVSNGWELLDLMFIHSSPSNFSDRVLCTLDLRLELIDLY